MDQDFILSADLHRSDRYRELENYISASALKRIKQSPAHYKEAEVVPPTEAMEFGSAYHCFVLEPDEFTKRYNILDDSSMINKLIKLGFKNPRATNDYKAFVGSVVTKTLNEKKSLISKEVFEVMKEMKGRLLAHPYARMLLTGGEAEVGYAGEIQTPFGSMFVKFKPDYIKFGKKIVADLKAVADASVDGFTRACVSMDHQIQAAFYSDLLNLMSPDKLSEWTFIFIAQEKVKPYAYNLFECSPQFIAQGRYEYQMLLQLYKYCVENNYWPGYQVFCPNRYGLVDLKMPPYAIKNLDYFLYDREVKPLKKV